MALRAFPGVGGSRLGRCRIAIHRTCDALGDLLGQSDADPDVDNAVGKAASDAVGVIGHGRTNLPLGLLLIGIALHPHLVRLGLRLQTIGLGFRLSPEELHLDVSIGLDKLPLLPGLSLGLEDPFLLNLDEPFAVLFLHPPEVGVVVGRDDVHHVEMRHRQSVFLKSRIDLFAEPLGDVLETLVDLEDVDAFLTYDPCEIALDAGDDEGAEDAIHALRCDGVSDVALFKPIGRSNKLDKESPWLLHFQEELTACADIDVESRDGIEEADLRRCAPLESGVGDEVDEVDLSMEDGVVLVDGKLVRLPKQRKSFGVEGVSSGAEAVQCLAVPYEDGLLGLMDDKLAAASEVLKGILPDEDVVRPFVLDGQDAVLLIDLRLLGLPLDINRGVADRADVGLGIGVDVDLAAAGRTMDVDELAGVVGIDEGVVADGADASLLLVVDDGVPTMGTDPGRQSILLRVDGIPALTRNLPRRKQRGRRLVEPPALRTLYQILRHFLSSSHG